MDMKYALECVQNENSDLRKKLKETAQMLLNVIEENSQLKANIYSQYAKDIYEKNSDNSRPSRPLSM